MSDDHDPDRDDDLQEAGDLEIPFDRLSPDAQRGVIEEYVTREGTDYGHAEVDLRTKVDQVRAQIARGEVVVLFDGKSRSVNLVRRDEIRRRS